MGISIITLIVSVLLFSLLARILSYQRTLHLFSWNPTYRRGFFILGLLSLSIPLTIILERSNSGWDSSPPIITSVLLLLVLIPAAVLYYHFRPIQRRIALKPLLVLTERRGAFGISDHAILWRSLQKEKTSVRLTEKIDGNEMLIKEDTPSRSHVIILKDLIPGTQYSYSIDSLDGISGSFSTCGESLRLAIVSDAHIGSSKRSLNTTKRIIQTIIGREDSFDLLLNLGDIVQMGNLKGNYEAASNVLLPLSKHLPSIMVPGNHDAWVGGLNSWKDAYYPKRLNSELRTHQLFHHYRPLEGVHIITLDLEWGTENFSKAQRHWLTEQLSTIAKDDMLIVASHAFFFGSGRVVDSRAWFDPMKMIDTFHPLFRDNHVNLVLSGHNHQFEHMKEDGIDYVIVGTFGGRLEKRITHRSSASIFLDHTHHGFAELSIDRSQYSLIFRNLKDEEIYRFSSRPR